MALNELFSLITLICISAMLIIHILFIRSCLEEKDNVLNWTEALKDNEMLRVIVQRLYAQRDSINKSLLGVIIICLLTVLGKFLK